MTYKQCRKYVFGIILNGVKLPASPLFHCDLFQSDPCDIDQTGLNSRGPAIQTLTNNQVYIALMCSVYVGKINEILILVLTCRRKAMPYKFKKETIECCCDHSLF